MDRDERTRSRRGFTLIEIMAVVLIIGLLSSIVGLAIFQQVDKSRVTAARAQLANLEGVLELYRMDNARFPTSEQGLQALIAPPGGENETVATRWDGPYLEFGELPKDPWGNEYQYAFPPLSGRGEYPDVWSFGPDGEDNTDDDICSWVTSKEGEEGEGELGGARDSDVRRDLDVGDVSVGGGEDEF